MPSPQKGGQAAAITGIATSNISNLTDDVLNAFQSNVTAPRNPKLIQSKKLQKQKVTLAYTCSKQFFN